MKQSEFIYLISLEFGKKIARTVTQMMLFDRDEKGYVSLSGGKGSTVLADINQRFGINMPVVCVPSCEEPENIKVAIRYGAEFVNGKYTYKEIIDKYGYPMISKEVAMAISRHNRALIKNTYKTIMYRWFGDINEKTGKRNTKGVIPKKYRFLVYAPFDVSNYCCTARKKNPLKKWSRENSRLPVTGEMAVESRDRKAQYMKHGCIQEGKKATPMGFWTENDLDTYIERYDLNISEAYDDPECTRTGCPECGFGILKDLNRYKRVKKVRPNTYDHLMGGGQFVEKNHYRWVSFTPGAIPVWSNKYWVPSKEGLGLDYVITYINNALGTIINESEETK